MGFEGITVTGYGEASAPPDVLRARFAVGCGDVSVSRAMQAVAERTAAVTAALREVGVADADLQTSSVAVHQRHNRDGAPIGYRAVHSITATCRDAGRAGRLLSAAGDAGGNDLSIDHVGLDLDAREPVLAKAREAAFEDARRRAEHYAVLAGRRLGAVVVVHEGPVAGPPEPRHGVRLMAAESADLGIEAGENTVRTSVTVSWSWA
jgi:uncharacterized protein YggE